MTAPSKTTADERVLCPPRSWWTPWRIALFVTLLVACALTRFLDLGAKPIMHDESLFAYYTEFTLHREMIYNYEPILHGPAMLWIQLLVFQIFGVSDYTLRLGAALLGFTGFFWIWSLRRWLGNTGIWVALAFYVVSTSLTFYQRFFRNDALFVFATLWIVASAAWWWRTRKPGWLASFLLANVVLFCNKESSLFVYFGLITFLCLLVVHDLAKWLFHGDAPGKYTVEESGLKTPTFPSPIWVGGALFVTVTLILTQVLEGIAFKEDVVKVIGRDFVLRDVRSIPLALGWMQPIEDAGALGRPGTWQIFYTLLAILSFGGAWILRWLVNSRVGAEGMLARFWVSLYRGRYAAIGALGFGFLLYMALFTTFFKFPRGPFEIYHDTLAYWIGQHEQHRIRGPFHMHMVNMLVYELPQVILVLGMWFVLAAGHSWKRTTGVSLVLSGLGFSAFHVLFFHGIESAGMSYFLQLAAWSILAGIVFCVRPAYGKRLFLALIALLVFLSALYFNSNAWRYFLTSAVTKEGAEAAWSGRTYLDENLSLTSGMHLFLIAFLILMGTQHSWMAIERGRRFEAFLVWWLITMTGAASYAREKVPWVGIHIALPLILLAGVYAEAFFQHARKRAPRLKRPVLAGAVLAIALVWNGKAMIAACFLHPGDVRERIVYGETPKDVKDHVEYIYRKAELAGIQHVPVGTKMREGISGGEGHWKRQYNKPEAQKAVRVVVANNDLVWPMRWYLRDMEWREAPQDPYDASKRRNDAQVLRLAREEWPFMFLSLEHADIPAVRENYALYRAKGRMHWIPDLADWKAMSDIWLVTVPRHYRDRWNAASRIQRSKDEWRAVRRYLLFRDVFEQSDMRLSTVEYYFAVHRDIDERIATFEPKPPENPGEPIPGLNPVDLPERPLERRP